MSSSPRQDGLELRTRMLCIARLPTRTCKQSSDLSLPLIREVVLQSRGWRDDACSSVFFNAIGIRESWAPACKVERRRIHDSCPRAGSKWRGAQNTMTAEWVLLQDYAMWTFESPLNEVMAKGWKNWRSKIDDWKLCDNGNLSDKMQEYIFVRKA